MTDWTHIDAWDFALPPHLVAHEPAAQRRASRLLVVDPVGGAIEDATFATIVDRLGPDDLLVVNDAKVSPVRLRGHRSTGGRVEVFVVGLGDEGRWDADGPVVAMLRSNKRLGEGEWITIGEAHRMRFDARGCAGLARLSLDPGVSLDDVLTAGGEVPLPPYILKRRRDLGEAELRAEDAGRYQTVYADRPGAVAAPTAGLHFDDALLATLAERGVRRASVTLLVGAGTFKPVQTDRLDDHEMHTEAYDVPQATVDAIAETRRRGGRVVAVGTTVVRTLEAASAGGMLSAGAGRTALFIRPGFAFAQVDALITNFHLPKSTLLALVGAMTGPELLLDAYAHAVREGYRFYSYGDAMFVPRRPR